MADNHRAGTERDTVLNSPKTLILRSTSSGLEAVGDRSVELGYTITDGTDVVSGIYCNWHFEGGVLKIENDRFGIYPVFYALFDSTVVLSTDIVAVLQAARPAELDHDALATFSRLGFYVGNDTPFANVNRLPPNAQITWTSDGFQVTGHTPSAPEAYCGSREAAIDDYIDLFRQSMRRILDAVPAFQLPLSGGRDSRHILWETLYQYREPAVAVTSRFLPPRNENDVDIVRRLLANTSVSLQVITPYFNVFPAAEDHNRLTQFMSWEHVWSLALKDQLVANQLPVLDGLGGDVLSAGLYQNRHSQKLFRTSPPEDCAEYILRERRGSLGASELVLKTLFTSDFHKKTSPACARQRLIKEVEEHQHHPNPLQRFNFFNRTRNGPGMFSMGVLSGVPTYMPYLDYDLFQFLDSLPPEMVADKQFHSVTIQSAYPEKEQVPYSSRSRSARFGPMWRTFYFFKLLASLKQSEPNLPVRNMLVVKRSIAATLRSGSPLETWWKPLLVQYFISLWKVLCRYDR